MRIAIIALALLAAACVDVKRPQHADAGDGYTLEVRANAGEQIFLVTSPDGHTVGGRAADGASALMDDSAIHQLGDMHIAENEDLQQVVSLRLPGLDLSVSGDPDSTDENGRGRVSINVGGHSLEVNASEGGPGEDDDRAHVRITGATESEAREFIAKADQLSPAIQAQMLTGLGLE